ncbi:MAG: hypothetical protein WCO12_02455 [bacterium]
MCAVLLVLTTLVVVIGLGEFFKIHQIYLIENTCVDSAFITAWFWLFFGAERNLFDVEFGSCLVAAITCSFIDGFEESLSISVAPLIILSAIIVSVSWTYLMFFWERRGPSGLSWMLCIISFLLLLNRIF